jgi:PKD repeat protein
MDLFSYAIVVGPAVQLAFTVQPSDATGGASITPTAQVSVQDAAGNVITTATDTITLAIGANPGTGTLAGTTSLAAVQGVASFSDVRINTAGTGYTLIASATGLPQASSTTFNITVGSPARVVFTVQPGTSEAGAAIAPAPRVTVVDAGGNVVTTATDSINLAIGNNPGGGTLSGTTTVAAANGVAAFSAVGIDKSGASYSLLASSGTLTGSTSAAFDVVGSTSPAITSGPTPDATDGTEGQPVSFTVAATDSSPLTYTWDFGDGTTLTTTSGTVSHTYLAPGVYTVTVTATDAAGHSSVSSQQFQVFAAGAVGGGGNVYNLELQRAQVKLAFPDTQSKDSLTVKGVVDLGDGFNPKGQQVQWQIGTIAGSTVLDAKGKSPKSSTVNVSLKYKQPKKGQPFTTRRALLSITLRDQQLGTMQLGGLPTLNYTTPGASATLDVRAVLVNHRSYAKLGAQGTYKATQDKSGMFQAKFQVKL